MRQGSRTTAASKALLDLLRNHLSTQVIPADRIIAPATLPVRQVPGELPLRRPAVAVLLEEEAAAQHQDYVRLTHMIHAVLILARHASGNAFHIPVGWGRAAPQLGREI